MTILKNIQCRARASTWSVWDMKTAIFAILGLFGWFVGGFHQFYLKNSIFHTVCALFQNIFYSFTLFSTVLSFFTPFYSLPFIHSFATRTVGFTWSSASSQATFEVVVFEELGIVFEDVVIFEDILEDAVESELDTLLFFEFFKIELGVEQLLFLLIFNRVRLSHFGIVAIESEIIELWSTSEVWVGSSLPISNRSKFVSFGKYLLKRIKTIKNRNLSKKRKSVKNQNCVLKLTPSWKYRLPVFLSHECFFFEHRSSQREVARTSNIKCRVENGTIFDKESWARPISDSKLYEYVFFSTWIFCFFFGF